MPGSQIGLRFLCQISTFEVRLTTFPRDRFLNSCFQKPSENSPLWELSTIVLNFDSKAGYFTNPDSFVAIQVSLSTWSLFKFCVLKGYFYSRKWCFQQLNFAIFVFGRGALPPWPPYKGSALDPYGGLGGPHGPRPIFLFFHNFPFSSLIVKNMKKSSCLKP